MSLRLTDKIILGVTTIGFVYTIGVTVRDCVRIHREGVKERERIRFEKSLDLSAIAYAGEKVCEKINNGDYRIGDINTVISDMFFFEMIKAEELREKYKDVL